MCEFAALFVLFWGKLCYKMRMCDAVFVVIGVSEVERPELTVTSATAVFPKICRGLQDTNIPFSPFKKLNLIIKIRPISVHLNGSEKYNNNK